MEIVLLTAPTEQQELADKCVSTFFYLYLQSIHLSEPLPLTFQVFFTPSSVSLPYFDNNNHFKCRFMSLSAAVCISLQLNPDSLKLYKE